ncbi:MAG TPA: glycosyltransferase family 4 protein [Drouetiella sp.]
MSKLKIAMVTTFFPPHNFGGDGVFVQRLSNALAHRGHEVHVIHDKDAFSLGSKALVANTSEGHDSTDPRVTVHSLDGGATGKLDLIATHQLGQPVGKSEQLKKLLDQNFDVIHFHNISLLGGPGVLAYGDGVKLCTLHDHWFVCSTHVLWRFDEEPCTKRTCMSCTLAAHRPPQLWRYTGAVERASVNVDAFLSPSEFARGSHLANGFPASIRVLPHFLAEPSTDIDSTPVHTRPFFLFVGRLEKIKGAQVLIEQFSQFNDADLIIVGNGNYEATLRNAAQGLNHVHFLGRMSSERLREYYRQAVAVLVPSLCFETFGLVPLEAFSVATPVIVNDLGALPEVVRDGGGIAYKTPAEMVAAMKKLLGDASLRREIGAAGLENFKNNYSEARHMERYLNLIAELQKKHLEVSCPVK